MKATASRSSDAPTPGCGAAGHRRGARSAVLFATVPLVMVAMSCASGAAPGVSSAERWYVGSDELVLRLAEAAVHDLGGQVVAETPSPRSLTAHFPEEVFGHGVYLDVIVERQNDESWVRASARPESAAVDKEDLELLRDRFLEALDAQVAETGGPSVRR